MKIEKLACPSCGAPLSGDILQNQRFDCSNCGASLILSDLETEDTIICPKCHTPNIGELRFCSSCGGQLKIGCPMCHTQNRADTVHCVNCGVHLERARAKRQRSLRTKQRLIEERRQAFIEKEARQKEEKLQRLLDALDEPENHDFAIYQLNQLGQDAVEPLIDTLLHDDDPDARYGSARALGQICSEREITGLIKARASKALIKALSDPEPATRYWAAEALGRFKGPQSQVAIEPLAALLKDEHQGVQHQAHRSLEQIGGKQVDEILADSKSKGWLGWIKGN